jgi:hypothetical protein
VDAAAAAAADTDEMMKTVAVDADDGNAEVRNNRLSRYFLF